MMPHDTYMELEARGEGVAVVLLLEAVLVPEEEVGDGGKDVEHHEAQEDGEPDLVAVARDGLEQELHQSDLRDHVHLYGCVQGFLYAMEDGR
jgi:hypothetical protein